MKLGRMHLDPDMVRTSGRSAAALIAISAAGLIAASSLSYLAFVAIALVPMVAAALLEKPGHRAATMCIGSMTLAAALPIVLGAIADGSTRDLLGSGLAWTFIGGAVLGGVAIFFVLPTATVLMDDMRASARVRDLRRRQALLEQAWGEEVRSTVGG